MFRRGITLIEVLVVVALVTFIIGMIIPAIQRVRESASRLACSSNLRQMAIALHQFHGDYGHLPPIRENKNIQSKDPVNVLTWMVYLLPYIEESDLFAKSEQAAFRESRPWLNPPHIGLSRVIKTYLCPTDSRLGVPLTDADGITAAYTSFIGVAGGFTPNGGVLGLYDGRFIKFANVYDGLTNTLMIGERPPPDTLQAGLWYPRLWFNGKYGQFRGPDEGLHTNQAPVGGDGCGFTGYVHGSTNNPCDRYHFWSLHPGGSNFAFADATVRFIKYNGSDILPKLASRNGGEVVEILD